MKSHPYHVRLLVTSDIHGALLPIDYARNTPIASGLAVLAPLMQKERTTHTFLLDCGDILQGSPLNLYHQMHRHEYPNPVAVMMNAIGYDFFVPGNHDFNFGRAYLESFISELDAKTLCANIIDESTQQPLGRPYAIIAFPEGPRIAIIGITTQYIPNWEKPEHIANLVFEHAMTSLKKTLEVIKARENVDLVVVAYHGGFERDLDTDAPYIEDTGENLGSRMLREVEGIDVLITGHQHRSIARTIAGVTVVQPESYGRAYARIDVAFSFRDRWVVQEKLVQLVHIDRLEPDPELMQLIAPISEATNHYIDHPIGRVPDDDLRITDPFLARLHKHKIVTLINHIQIEASGAMLSCCSLGNEVSGFSQSITIRDIINTYVFPNSLVVVEITGEKLRQALEKNAAYFALAGDQIVCNPRFYHPKLEHYNYDMFDGIDYTIDVSMPLGRRIVSMRYQGKEVDDGDIFTLAMNNYRASGGGEFWMYQNLKIVYESHTDIVTMIIDYINRHQEIRVPNIQNIDVIIGGMKK
ncbi:MAG: bifunctional UDP-sugar hydrolase/5'-nucleotidase [Candidatus Izemoplasmatales bacterium]|nr:bifunctional UDP-sugar hydrolase/5'-nucleotidase [Candidatus Izemoplasmatales bacterium]